MKNWPYPQYAQDDDADVAKNEHINHNVYGFVNDNVPTHNEWKRSSAPPKSAEVANWPFPQYAQAEAEDIAKNKYINQKVHGMASKYVPVHTE